MPRANACVSSMEAEFDLITQQNTTGRQIFDQIVKSINLAEVHFFGLQFTDSLGHSAWLKLNKRISDHDLKKESPFRFHFRVKFYPEDVTYEVLQPITLRLLYLQIKKSILLDEIYCPPDISVSLASFAVQTKLGDYSSELERKLSHERLLPQRVLNQHTLSKSEWEEQIITWWKEHQGMTPQVAMMEYMKTAQNLDMYGINYFQIKNRKGTELWLGVDALGLNIYSKYDQLTPKIAFPWSEIHKILFENRRFIIRPLEQHSPDFVFFSALLRFNKRILAICVGNHELFLRRRRPEAMRAMTKWRSSVKTSTKYNEQERQQRQRERQMSQEDKEKLEAEIAARELAEGKQLEYEKKLKKMKKEVENSQIEVTKAQDIIRRLEEELGKLRETKALLEEKQFELEEMISHLATSGEIQLNERQRLEEEIRLRQEEVERIRMEVARKDEETKRLQEEVEKAKRLKVDAAAAIIHPGVSADVTNGDYRRKPGATEAQSGTSTETETDTENEESRYTKTGVRKTNLLKWRQNHKIKKGNSSSDSESETSNDEEEEIDCSEKQIEWEKSEDGRWVMEDDEESRYHQAKVAELLRRRAEAEKVRQQIETTAAIIDSVGNNDRRSYQTEATVPISAATAIGDATPYEDRTTPIIIGATTKKDAKRGSVDDRGTAAIIASSRNPNARPQRPNEQSSWTQDGDEEVNWALPFIDRRISERERNARLHTSFRKLTLELAEKRDETKDTPMDKIHHQNLKLGRNKYGSLREVRRGDTKRRVDFFENM